MWQATYAQFASKRLRRNQGLCVAIVIAAMAAAGCTTTTKVTGVAENSPTTGATTGSPTAGSPTAESTSASPNSPGANVTTFGDGTYTVGKTVKAGTYRAVGPSSFCYWERLKGFSGDLDDIIANNTTGDPSVVTILPTDKGFRTDGCGTWTSDLSQITKSKTEFGAGTYIVGTDIDPGTYHAPGGDTCYWARLSGFTGSLDDILANANPTGSTTVTISPSDKGFESSGCGTFTQS